MAVDTQPLFDGPIPGMSMTTELGGRPWQQPPQYTNVDEAIEYYMDRMTTDEFMDELVDVLEMGVSIADIANIMQTSSVMEGVHSVDVGILVSPVLMEMMMFLAESAGIEYVTGLETRNKKKISDSKIAKIIQKLEREVGDLEEPEETEELKVEEANNEPTGLMARRK